MALVTVGEVVDFAKISTSLSEGQQQAIVRIIAAASSVVEKLAGPQESASKVWRFIPRPGPIVLPWRFNTVTSIVVDGVTVSSTLYDGVTRADRGIIDAVGWEPWSSGDSCVVTVAVGSTVPAANVKLAALELCSFWWRRTQQNPSAAWSGGDVPMGFAVPQAVRELLEPTAPMPGFA